MLVASDWLLLLGDQQALHRLHLPTLQVRVGGGGGGAGRGPGSTLIRCAWYGYFCALVDAATVQKSPYQAHPACCMGTPSGFIISGLHCRPQGVLFQP
jgi:hypothetical protein